MYKVVEFRNYIPLFFIDLDRTCASPTVSTHKPNHRLLAWYPRELSRHLAGVDTVLENNCTMKKSQTLIPLGMAGAGKTWICLVMLRRLLRKCGYDEQTDMVKHVEAAADVIRPMVTACVGGSKVSSRMVRFV